MNFFDMLLAKRESGGGGPTITDGTEVLTRGSDDLPLTAVHYGNTVHNSQYWGRTTSDGPWKNLTTMTFHDEVTTIQQYSFAKAGKLTNLDLSHVRTINSQAFGECRSLTEAYMPELTLLKDFAFTVCTSLRTVYAPKLQTPTYQRSFSGCTALEEVQIGSIGYAVTNLNNLLFQSDTQTTLTITIYTTGEKADLIIDAVRNSATGATIVIKASEATTYGGTSYAAGDTIVTSTP